MEAIQQEINNLLTVIDNHTKDLELQVKSWQADMRDDLAKLQDALLKLQEANK